MKKLTTFRSVPSFRTALRAISPALMIASLACMSFTKPQQTPPDYVTLQANTTIRLKLAQDYAQRDLRKGTDVEFTVLQDISVDDYVKVITANAPAFGTVTENNARKVEIEFRDVQAIDTKSVLLKGKWIIERAAREGSIFLKQGTTISPTVKSPTVIRLTARQ
jgi:nitrogen fixation protein FixH